MSKKPLPNPRSQKFTTQRDGMGREEGGGFRMGKKKKKRKIR